MTRVALIGLGAAARTIHLPAYRRLGARIEVVGGADPDPAARAAATALGVPATYDNPGALLRAARPDLVAVCSPPAAHREHTLQALAAGCHVFLEKPLAETLDDADAIIHAAAAAGREVVVNQQFPDLAIHRAAKAALETKAVGRLLHLHAWHAMRPTAETEAGWRGRMTNRVGLEFGVHVFDLIRFFFDQDPVRVLAHLPRPDPAAPWDAVMTAGFEFADGRGASCVLNRVTRGPERYLDLRLDGECATIHSSIGGRARLGLGIHLRERRPYLEARLALGGYASLQLGTRERVIAREGLHPFAGATARHLATFLDALEGGPPPRARARDNRATLALVLAAYESARSGRAVELASGGRS